MIEEERKLKKLAKQAWIAYIGMLICLLLIAGAGTKIIYKINREHQPRQSSLSSMLGTAKLGDKFNHKVEEAYGSSAIVRGWLKVSPQPDNRSLAANGNIYLAGVVIVFIGFLLASTHWSAQRNELLKLKKKARDEVIKERFKETA